MKHYNRIIFGIILLGITLACLSSAVLYHYNINESNRSYKIDINRINALLAEGRHINDIDTEQLNSVVKIDELQLPCSKEDLSDFFSGSSIPRGFDFTIQPVFSGNLQNKTGNELANNEISGYLRFTYASNKSNSFPANIIALNLSLLIMLITITSILVYIRHSILKPFNEIVQMPYELSRGHLKAELLESKNKFFGKFIWGLDLLRESLETHKNRELQLVKEKKTMILSISHDIKTPLSAIKLYSRAIYDNLYISQEKREEAAKHIEEKADQIESFVGEIIAASTQEILDIQVNPGEFYLSRLINQIKKTYSDKLEILKTDFYVDNFEEILLKGDLEKLIEVFENIIENAIKYGDGKLIKISFSDEDYCKLITVTNSGVPVPGTEFVHMFESFWRGANAHSKKGSGLGLYICKEIMRKLEGDIFAESTDNTMSFTVVVRYG